MKKLFTLSLLMLGFLTSFADNGENEMSLNLNSISVEKPMAEDPPEFIYQYYKYKIMITISGIVLSFETECLDTVELGLLTDQFKEDYNNLFLGSIIDMEVVILEPCDY